LSAKVTSDIFCIACWFGCLSKWEGDFLIFLSSSIVFVSIGRKVLSINKGHRYIRVPYSKFTGFNFVFRCTVHSVKDFHSSIPII
jgi:hypothetical protein